MTAERSEQITQRVFCIGMNKTGTSTMKSCFEILNLKPVASPKTINKSDKVVIKEFYSDHNYEALIELAENYQSFEDRPWNMWEAYRHLDQHFPDSLFILTVRHDDSWWASVENWVTVIKPKIVDRYKMHLRCNDYDKESFIESYSRHNKEVVDYFKGSNKLLIMNLEKGDGWKKLCDFLGKPMPTQAFPHANKQSYNATEKKLVVQTRKKIHKAFECQVCHHITPMAKVSKPKKTAIIKTQSEPLNIFLEKMLGKSLKFTRKKKLRESLKFMRIEKQYLRPIQYKNQLAALKKNHPKLTIDRLAIVACFFNPSGSKRRVKNFNKFLQGLERSGVHTLVVELAFGSRKFEIEHEHIIRLRSDSIMWHKERLLNIGIKQLLNAGYQQIVWLDGDITLTNPNWPWLIAAQLEEHRLCQIFSRARIEAADGTYICKTSAAKRYQENGYRLKNGKVSGQTGFGWAARADVLQHVLLYENAIVGGGDKMIFMASIIQPHEHDHLKELTYSHIPCEKCGHRNMSLPYTTNYLAWAHRWSQAVNRQVGYVEMEIKDMFHGKRSDRKYMSRRNILFRHEYDPDNDLTVDGNSSFEWADNKQEFSKDMHSYFLSRRENV